MSEQNKKIPFEERLAALGLTKEDFYALVKLGATLDGLEKKQHPLAVAIYKKLKTREHAHKLQCFLGVLARLSDERQRPSPDDEITNPLAIRDPYNDYGGAVYSTVAEKRAFYNKAIENHETAICGYKQFIPLGQPGAEFNDVEFIAGCWRCQIKCPYEITDVRDRQFVLVKKLAHQEHTKFEFWAASAVVWTGRGVGVDIEKPDWVVAKYETDRGTYMAYGPDIKSARAYLGIKLYDEYQDLIDLEIRKNQHQK